MALCQRYRLGAELGSGSWFTTFDAFDVHAGRPVVAKRMHGALLADSGSTHRWTDLLSQVRALPRPGLVRVLDVWSPAGELWSVEERVQGRSLMGHLRTDPPPVATVLNTVVRVLETLAAVHDSGLVHGCVHPGVVRMDPERGPLLADVGLAAVDTTRQGPRLCGTAQYHDRYAPFRGRPTPAVDTYAVGVVLRECLAAATRRHGDRAPDGLVEVAERATSSDPTQRFGSGAEMVDAMRATTNLTLVRDAGR